MSDPKLKITATDETRAAFASVSRNLDQLKSSVGLVSRAIPAVAAALAALNIAQSFKSAIDAADQLDELSQKVGISAETISSLSLAIKLGGTDIDGFTNGLKKLSVNMVEAQRGAGDAADAFKAIGVSVESSPGALKSVDEVLLDLAEKFEQMEDGAGKTALAMQIFGKAGADLVPFLNQGRSGIERLREEAKRLGLVIGGETAAAAGRFKDNLDVLEESAGAMSKQLIAGLLPSLVRISEQMRIAAQNGGILAGVMALFREAAIEAFSDSTLERIDKTNQKIAEQLQIIERLESTPRKKGTIGPGRDDQIATARARLEALKQESLNLQELLKFEIPGGLNAGIPQAPKRQPPALPKKGAGDKPTDDFESTLKGLRQQIEATEALTEFEKILAGLESGRVKLAADPTIAASQREQLERAAAQLDLVREDKALREEVARVLEENAKAQAETQRREAEALNAARDRYLDLIDPVQKYRQQLEEVRTLLGRGLLSDDQAFRAFEALQKQIDGINDDIKEQQSLARDLGLTFSSAFEDAVTAGASFRDILGGIEKDLLRLGTRKLITEPVGKWFEGLLGSAGGLFGGGNSASSVGYQNSFDNPLTGGGGGGGGLFAGIFSGIKGLLGFANGGSFTVGGAGGVDSQVVAFRATPGERVDVTPPGRAAGGSPVNVVINMPPNVTRDTVMQAAARFGQVAQLALRRNR